VVCSEVSYARYLSIKDNIISNDYIKFINYALITGWPKAIMITYIVIGEVVPLIMSTYLVVTLMDVFVPILGRSGSETDANMFFGIIISALLTVLVFNGLACLFVNYDKRILFTCLFISVFLVNPMIVFGFIGKVPYQEKTPMRLSLIVILLDSHHPNSSFDVKM